MVREVTTTYLGSRDVVQHRSARHHVCGSGRVVDTHAATLIRQLRNEGTLANQVEVCCGIDTDYSLKSEQEFWEGAR
jgi:hypothetical protein